MLSQELCWSASLILYYLAWRGGARRLDLRKQCRRANILPSETLRRLSSQGRWEKNEVYYRAKR